MIDLARCITRLWFEEAIFQDYIRVIPNASRTTSTWSLVPTGEMDSLVAGQVPTGVGDQVSAGFDISCRWHLVTCVQCTQWLDDEPRKWTPARFDQVSLPSCELEFLGLG